MQIPDQYIKNIYRALYAFLFILCVFFAIKCLALLQSDSTIGNKDANTISLSGHGEVMAVPDIANVNFTIDKQSKTVADAQAQVATVEASVLNFLKTNNVASADIQTSNASFYPTYTNVRTACPLIPVGADASEIASDCGNNTQIISGYDANESITVKVRNIDTVGAIMQGLGSLGVSELNGPNFSVDNPDALQAEARKNAIDNAQAKAKVLAKDLGVTLGKITSFSESGNSPMPIYMEGAAMSAMAPSSAPAQIPKGENTITDDVTITYQIK